VVACDQHGRQLQVEDEAAQGLVEQFDRVRRRHGAVEHVARHQDDVRPGVPG
jgi:hypothetical protein